MHTDEPRTAMRQCRGQCNGVRYNLYCWTSQHDANVLRKHQGIVENVTGFPKASRHLLKRQGKNLSVTVP